ncbi:beta-ketoacyl-ACP synthase III [Carboxylicivirga sp. RSCT41]|uniref:beta-ketoacyl-ACP synthase III n=1 Tax=Carboxylicivirga agarovorans TaxID=3417570 RepID=UPI003D340D54
MPQVFITKTASFLPNDVVSSDEMEKYLGYINDKPSKSKAIVLRSNGIKQRHYALTEDGHPTHTNAEMVSLAIKNLFAYEPEEITKVDLITCGTTTPDQLLPSHSVMVHGLLPETGQIEVTSNAGSCCSGMHSLKFAYLSVLSGDKQHAVCAGSERISSIIKADTFKEEGKHLAAIESNPYVAFEKDFLRWMLSDGAGAFLLQDKPAGQGTSLRVEWIEMASFANKNDTCMYMGAEKQDDGSLLSYQNMPQQDLLNKSVLSIKQDVKLLSAQIVKQGFSLLKDILEKHTIKADEIDHFLPHMSSYFFKEKIYTILEENGIRIPYEKWYTNLREKGNIGAGSIYIMLDGLIKSGQLKQGEKVLLAVPESARFSYAFCLLTVC